MTHYEQALVRFDRQFVLNDTILGRLTGPASKPAPRQRSQAIKLSFSALPWMLG